MAGGGAAATVSAGSIASAMNRAATRARSPQARASSW
jgi:hypothetical protein